MSKLRLTQSGWEEFTGDFGGVRFEKGVSVENVTRPMIDRLSAIVMCELVNDDGKSDGQGGAAARMVNVGHVEAPVQTPLPRMTEEERKDELVQDNLRSDKPPVKIMTSQELQDIADREGIKGLRKIAAVWGVKDRKITSMIKEILEAQRRWLDIAEQRRQEMRRQRERAMKEAMEAQRRAEEELNAKARLITSKGGLSNAIGPNGENVVVDLDKAAEFEKKTASGEKPENLKPEDLAKDETAVAETEAAAAREEIRKDLEG